MLRLSPRSCSASISWGIRSRSVSVYLGSTSISNGDGSACEPLEPECSLSFVFLFIPLDENS